MPAEKGGVFTNSIGSGLKGLNGAGAHDTTNKPISININNLYGTMGQNMHDVFSTNLKLNMVFVRFKNFIKWYNE